MAFLIALLLLAPVLILAVLIRLGMFAGAGGFAEREGRDQPVSPQDLLTAIDRDIAQLESRLEDYQRCGGSGTWTARFAASWRRHRLAELRMHRSHLLSEISRWRPSRKRSTAVCLERSPSAFQTRAGAPIGTYHICRHDSLE
jgi:hypothetical protein